jgi:hypothetical protein
MPDAEVTGFDKNRHTDIRDYLRNNPFKKEVDIELKKPKTILRWILLIVLMWGISTELGYFSWSACSISLLLLTTELNDIVTAANTRIVKKACRFLAYHFSVSEYVDTD